MNANVPLYECRKCGRSFEELDLWGRLKFYGDHWKCTSCDCDITKNLDIWFKELNDSLLNEKIFSIED